jgi:hypothetical protein
MLRRKVLQMLFLRSVKERGANVLIELAMTADGARLQSIPARPRHGLNLKSE